jgi:DNA-binding GntR family transcriptional regulator
VSAAPALTQSEYRRPQSAQQAVLDELRYRLLAGLLEPGDQVRQETVASELQTSVVPVREALKILEAEGLIEHVPRRGFFVARLTRDELIELCEIRSALETIAVDRALASVGEAQVERMVSLMAEMNDAEDAGDIVRLVRLDREFHFVVFLAGRSSQLMRLISTMWDQSDLYRAAFLRDERHRVSSRREHELIVEAVRRADRDELVGLLDRHRLSPLEEVDLG